MRLKDKIAVITGAGSGSGRAGAMVFSREGAKVVVGDIDTAAGEETTNMVKNQGGEAIFVKIDAGKVIDMKRLIDTAVDTYGKLNILWNHVGIPGPGTIEDTDEDAFDRAIDVNCKGGFFATKFAIPHMKNAGGGSILFTSSISALRASPWSPAYSMTKGGFISLTMSLAAYLGPDNIRTNCICPGIIDSPMARIFVDRSGSMSKNEVEGAVTGFGDRVPMGRIATPDDIANAALYLASDEASYVNGVIFPVDGGTIVRY